MPPTELDDMPNNASLSPLSLPNTSDLNTSVLSEPALQQALQHALPDALSLRFFAHLPSTQTYLQEIQHWQNQSAILVVTNEQTQGRGRHGGAWHSQAGQSLTFSLGLKLPLNTRLEQLPIQVALCLATTLQQHSKNTIKIKWPNDLYSEVAVESNRVWGKFAGVLMDCISRAKAYNIVIGVGINLSVPPSQAIDCDYPIAAFYSAMPAETLLATLCQALYDTLIRHPASTINPRDYQLFDLLDQQRVAVSDVHPQSNPATPALIGLAQGINDKGQLQILDEQQNRHTLTSQKRIRLL